MKLFIIILLITIGLLSFYYFHFKLRKPPIKVNKHGLPYKTQLFTSYYFHLGFYNKNTKQIIWLLRSTIDHDNYSWYLGDWRPIADKAWFPIEHLPTIIDTYETIETVIEYNKKVREKVQESQGVFDKRHNDIVKEVKKYG